VTDTRTDLVPVIDLDAARHDTEARRAASAAIDTACRTSGFFAVLGHGIADATIGEAVDRSREFFALPFDQKSAVAPTEPWGFRGYLGVDATALAATLGDATPPDLSESFNIARFEGAAPGEDRPIGERSMLAPNRWPEHPAALRPALERCFAEMEQVAFELAGLAAEALELPTDWFASSLTDGTSLLLVNHYPAVEEPPLPGQLRRGAHTDYGILTLLYAEDEPGLQIQRDGQWFDVPHVPGALIVNVGDLMARWVNDRWVSTLHRVVVPDGVARDRVSIPFFFQPRYDAVVETAPTTVTSDQPARYRPVIAGEWIAAKSAAMLPDD
jgi:isopenicillin N synthase-like dioxygenase